jgi:signal transduction histidine kinase
MDAASIWGEIFDPNGHRIPSSEWPWSKALQGQTTIGSEFHLAPHPGHSYDILFSACPIRGVGSRIVGAFSLLVDITEHKRRELALRKAAVLTERGRLAADIHDGVIQGLSAVVTQAEAAEEEIVKNPAGSRERLRRLREVARESLAEARRSMWALNQESFDEEDPAEALELLARRLFEGTPVKLQFSLEEGARTIPVEMRRELLQIGKEALSNVLKHAHATTVSIDIAYLQRDVRLSIQDDGRGFMFGSLSSGGSNFGLYGMRTRAKRLGGELIVDSRPGRGTQIIALVPLPYHLAKKRA